MTNEEERKEGKLAIADRQTSVYEDPEEFIRNYLNISPGAGVYEPIPVTREFFEDFLTRFVELRNEVRRLGGKV